MIGIKEDFKVKTSSGPVQSPFIYISHAVSYNSMCVFSLFWTKKYTLQQTFAVYIYTFMLIKFLVWTLKSKSENQILYLFCFAKTRKKHLQK